MTSNNANQMLSMHIANSVGCPSRAPLLSVDEYDHWKLRMEQFLKGKDKGKEIWRSITEGPHLPARTTIINNVARTLGAEGTVEPQLTALDLEKIAADNSAISELVFGIPPSLFCSHQTLQKCQGNMGSPSRSLRRI